MLPIRKLRVRLEIDLEQFVVEEFVLVLVLLMRAEVNVLVWIDRVTYSVSHHTNIIDDAVLFLFVSCFPSTKNNIKKEFFIIGLFIIIIYDLFNYLNIMIE